MAEIDNVLLIVVDALRPDRIGAYGDSEFTPNIDRLSERAEVFESAYACINATDPSMTTILSGLYPTSHGLLNHQKHITDPEREHVSAVSMLPQFLDSTHTTIGVDILERWHQKGFDNYLTGEGRDTSFWKNAGEAVLKRLPHSVDRSVRRIYRTYSGRLPTPYMTASEATDLLLEELSSSNRPWFSLVHYWDTHLPYVPLSDAPANVRNRTYPDGDVSLAEATEHIDGSPWRENLLSIAGEADTVGDMKRKFDAGVSRVDDSIGRIVNYLREGGENENTMIVITADHGESLGENGIYFDHHTLYEPSIHVPLIIDAPGFEGRSSMFVQHFDIVPTILDMLGAADGPDNFDGISLSPQGRDVERTAVFHEEAHTARRRAIRTRQYLYIKRIGDRKPCRYCNRFHSKEDELYDLQDGSEGLIEEEQGVISGLEDQMANWIQARPQPGQRRVNFDSSGEIKQRLEDMGYL